MKPREVVEKLEGQRSKREPETNSERTFVTFPLLTFVNRR
jgi:hypothetical protein